MDKERIDKQKALAAMLARAIPDFQKLSANYRQRITNCFKEKIFLKGQVLLKEGEFPKLAYIITKGECQILSRSLSISDVKSKQVGVKHQKSNSFSFHERGYLSNTTKTYQIGIVGYLQWAGDEVVHLRQETPFPYSISAKSDVVVLEITCADLLSKIPRDMLGMMERNAKSKLDWTKERMDAIRETSTLISRMDPGNKVYSETYQQISKIFPKVTGNTLHKLRKYKLKTLNNSMFSGNSDFDNSHSSTLDKIDDFGHDGNGSHSGSPSRKASIMGGPAGMESTAFVNKFMSPNNSNRNLTMFSEKISNTHPDYKIQEPSVKYIQADDKFEKNISVTAFSTFDRTDAAFNKNSRKLSVDSNAAYFSSRKSTMKNLGIGNVSVLVYDQPDSSDQGAPVKKTYMVNASAKNMKGQKLFLPTYSCRTAVQRSAYTRGYNKTPSILEKAINDKINEQISMAHTTFHVGDRDIQLVKRPEPQKRMSYLNEIY